MDLFNILKKLTEADGVSGTETNAAKVAAEMLEPYVDSITFDKRGTVIGRTEGKGPLIHFDAHIDQIGMIITFITDEGFLKFDSCGGMDARILPGREVMVMADEPFTAIITSVPPHLRADKDNAVSIRDLSMDTGFTKEQLINKVELGTRACFISDTEKLLGNQVAMKAMDDRSAVAALILLAKMLHEEGEKYNVLYTFSVQEEVGGKGASTAVFNYPVDTSIAVDVSFANTPGCKPEDTGNIGEGPMVGFSPLHTHDLSKELCKLAEKEGIPYQHEVMSGRTGTHADELAVTAEGRKSGLVSIPEKYMHTALEIVDTEDVENTAKLLKAYVENRGKGDN